MTTKITPDQELYQLLSRNVTAVNSMKRSLNRQINLFLRKDDSHSVNLYTKLYAQIYFTWTEANLTKLIGTPSGFSQSQISQILGKKNIIDKWKFIIDISFSKFRKKGSEIPNKKKEIKNLIDDYLTNQAIIRNKLAHGQWEAPLYRKRLTLDNEAKTLMDLIDVIQIDTWFEIAKELIEIVRGLIDARLRNDLAAHYNSYYHRLQSIQEIITNRRNRTIGEKQNFLKRKTINPHHFIKNQE